MWSFRGLAVVSACLLAGCGPQRMADQPRIDPLELSRVFADQRGSRTPVEGTVTRGEHPRRIDAPSTAFLTGQADGRPVEELPAELVDGRSMDAILQRGKDRYEVFCSHCHDLLGNGTGMVVKRGYPEPPTYHSDRLRQAPLGYLFEVISDGKGRMPAHAGQIPPADRWTIVAYIRALQLSQNAPAGILEASDLEALSRSQSTAGGAP